MSPHDSARFPCPACGAALRLRERRFVGATFPCPDCGATLTLLSLQNGQATVQLADPPSLSEKRSQPALPVRPTISPVLIGWIIAALAGCVVIGLVLLSSGRQPAHEVALEPKTVIEPPPEKPTPPPPPIVVEVDPPEAPVVPVEPPPPVVPRVVFDDAADPPISALEAIPPTPIVPTIARPDPQAVLNQRLARFDQLRPVSRRELLTMVEDLIGRPIADSEEAAAALDQAVTVSLTDGTVADLVGQILANTDLQLAITPDAARLQRRAPTDAVTVLLPR